MNILWVGLGYLVAGVIAILLLDLITGRVRKKLKGASAQTQALTGENATIAVIVTVCALWLFWPFAIYGAVTKGGGE